MSIVAAIVTRNLRLFFRDRLNVLFSLLSGLILFLLYALFLGRLQIDGLATTLPRATDAQIAAFVDSWMLSGIVMLTTVTGGIGALSTLVEDRASGRFGDFLVAPIRRGHLVLGYLLSSVAVSVVMSAVILAVTVVYLGLVRGAWLSLPSIAVAAGAMILCCLAFTALAAFGASFLRTAGAYSAFATVLGTILGFVAGAYIPVGSLPTAVATTINVLPFAQGAMLLRGPFTVDTLDTVAAGDADAAQGLREFYGIDLFDGSAQIAPWIAVVVLLAVAVGFTALSAGRIRAVLR
ncbi:ABC transporter permease [Microbacterium aurum]